MKPNDKRHLMMAFIRPTPVCVAVRQAHRLGPMPAIAVFWDTAENKATIFEVMP